MIEREPGTDRALTAVTEFKSVPVNLRVRGIRTSMRLDGATLSALDRLATEEGLTRHQVADLVATRLPKNASLAAALRSFVLAYWMYRARQAAD